MRGWIVVASLAVSAPAAAEPCHVEFVTAPAEVRAAIKHWVLAESTCDGTIAVRVVPTQGGMYVIGERADRTIHERWVPSLDAAGVLVASWLADGSPTRAPAPVVETHERADAQPAPPRSARRDEVRWLSASGLIQLDGNGGGVRAELDLWRRRWLTVGLSASRIEVDQPLFVSMTWPSYSGLQTLRSSDYRVAPYAAVTLGGDRWELRAALGVGYQHSESDMTVGPLDYAGTASAPVVEAQLMAAFRLGDAWAIATGPLVSWSQQRYDAMVDGQTLVRAGGGHMWQAVLRRRL